MTQTYWWLCFLRKLSPSLRYPVVHSSAVMQLTVTWEDTGLDKGRGKEGVGLEEGRRWVFQGFFDSQAWMFLAPLGSSVFWFSFLLVFSWQVGRAHVEEFWQKKGERMGRTTCWKIVVPFLLFFLLWAFWVRRDFGRSMASSSGDADWDLLSWNPNVKQREKEKKWKRNKAKLQLIPSLLLSCWISSCSNFVCSVNVRHGGVSNYMLQHGMVVPMRCHLCWRSMSTSQIPTNSAPLNCFHQWSLGHPDIKVNLKNRLAWTPFAWVWEWQSVVVQLTMDALRCGMPLARKTRSGWVVRCKWQRSGRLQEQDRSCVCWKDWTSWLLNCSPSQLLCAMTFFNSSQPMT